MKFSKEVMPLNKNIYNKLNNICVFNNVKLKFKNGLISKVDKTNVNFIEPYRFIIKVNDIYLVLLCYDNLNLYLYNKNIVINAPMLKKLINVIRIWSNYYVKEKIRFINF